MYKTMYKTQMKTQSQRTQQDQEDRQDFALDLRVVIHQLRSCHGSHSTHTDNSHTHPSTNGIPHNCFPHFLSHSDQLPYSVPDRITERSTSFQTSLGVRPSP